MSEGDWRPSCQLEMLQARARLLAQIRDFFGRRHVLEVETPLLAHATGTDPQLDFFATRFNYPPENPELYLQTSPEFAMKRLLAAGSGSIYQICKAFRNSELGRFHNPEFTILEWYRVGFSLQQLMQEVSDLLVELLLSVRDLRKIAPMSYQEIFFAATGLNPFEFELSRWQAYANENGLQDALTICQHDHATWLDYLFSFKVQPQLEKNAICLVYGYPAIQSSLARINEANPNVAERFEVFIDGIELGNGFFELSDAAEQEKRFDKEILTRKMNNQIVVEKDQRFLSALRAGLPECSGVAIGLDRLLMLITGKQSIDEVLAFSVMRA